MRPMKHVKRSAKKSTVRKGPCIKIYTTPEFMAAVAARAKDQGRSVSGHGQFLFRQDLLAASPRQVA